MNNESQQDKKVVLGDQHVRVLPDSPVWKILLGLMSTVLCVTLPLAVLSRVSDGPLAGLSMLLNGVSAYVTALSALLFGLLLLVWWFKLRPPRMDQWLKDIAHKRLGADYIFFRGKWIFVHYDVSMGHKEIMDFVTEVNDKSEHFTYYMNNIDIDNYTISINIGKRQEIPKRCSLDVEADTLWNFVPLGMTVNHSLRTVGPIGWYLNDLNKNDQAVESLPSTSALVCGGTGSGKSVVENNIISHCTRHSDHIQLLLSDCKRVEFGGLEEFRGVKAVALTVEETEKALLQARKIMQDRFRFMERNRVNNVYKVDTECDWFEIGGRQYQFDEIVTVTINGERSIMTMAEVYEAVQEGQEVDLDEKYLM